MTSSCYEMPSFTVHVWMFIQDSVWCNGTYLINICICLCWFVIWLVIPQCHHCGWIHYMEVRKRPIYWQIKAWVSYNIHCFLWDAITHPYIFIAARNCNCHDSSSWTEDEGFLDDVHRFPIKTLVFGGTVDNNQDMYYALGPLSCRMGTSHLEQ